MQTPSRWRALWKAVLPPLVWECQVKEHSTAKVKSKCIPNFLSASDCAAHTQRRCSLLVCFSWETWFFNLYEFDSYGIHLI